MEESPSDRDLGVLLEVHHRRSLNRGFLNRKLGVTWNRSSNQDLRVKPLNFESVYDVVASDTHGANPFRGTSKLRYPEVLNSV